MEQHQPQQSLGLGFGEQLHESALLTAYAMPDDVTVTDLKLDGPPSILVIILDILAALLAIGAVIVSAVRLRLVHLPQPQARAADRRA